ncbi:MAG TPA: DUF4175 family protein [Bacteroidia bacterium]|nr:DUF4175 family protein [Bacteroidia bacterium]
MENTANSYDTLIGKLDEFIRKFYKNQLIRGLLYATGILLGGFLLLTVSEYFARFDTIVRTVLFWGFLSSAAVVLTRLVAIPLFRLYKIGKLISHDEAATIIGRHFSNVQDKLLNVLQLRRNGVIPGVSPALIEASIDQKIAELRPVPFAAAIDLRQNKKYVRYAAIPLLVMLAIFFTNAGMITESANRLVHHATYFEEEAPFRFVIQNKDLKAVENEDFPLQVKLTGDEIPESVYILADGNEYKLSRENTIDFSYVFRNVQKSKKFRFEADGFSSKEYTLEVLPNPIVLNFDVDLNYPAYTGKKDETLKNTGDLVVPAGTQITWKFATRATRNFTFALSDTAYNLMPTAENQFRFTQRFLSGRNYSLHTSNEYLESKDSIHYAINVIPDHYPAISVEEKKDSASRLRLYFSGEVKDDYGFSKLAFIYRSLNRLDSLGKEIPQKTLIANLRVNSALQRDQFYHYWDLSGLDIAAGEEIEYYFEIWDNDAVHGAKSTRSQRMIYHAPTQKELEKQNDANNKKIEEELEASLAESQLLQKDIDELFKKLMEKKSLGWEDKKKLEVLMKRQQALQQRIDNLKQQNASNISQQNEFMPDDPNAQEKQEEMQNLFEQLTTEDMKKLLMQMQQMGDKEKTQKDLDQMKEENADTQKDLDRALNLFRDMLLKQKLEEAIKELDQMARQEDSLSNQNAQKNQDKEQKQENQKAQDSLNKQFEEFRQKMDQIDELNKKLESPHEIPNTDLKELEIQQEQREGSQNMKDGSQSGQKKASQNQKSAADKMDQLSQELQSAQQKMEEEQQSEDAQAIRQLLSNLLQLSFDQEALMMKVRNTGTNDPQYPNLAREQKKLRDDSKIIEDSLLALSKRNPKVSPIVNKKITDIKMNMERSQNSLGDRSAGEAQNRQQQAMTAINDLALMLDESLQSMMMQQNQQNKGDCKGGNCKKPGNGKNKPGMGSMRKQQQQINMKMGKMQKEGGTAEDFAKLAAQQEELRRMLEELSKGGKKDGGGPDPGGETQKKMEETENDLVNKRITAETIKRQNEIMDKMLEFEKAEKQKEMDNERQSNEAKNQQESNPEGFSEYKRLREKEAELLKTVPPALSPFYKGKVSIYFNGVEKK